MRTQLGDALTLDEAGRAFWERTYLTALSAEIRSSRPGSPSLAAKREADCGSGFAHGGRHRRQHVGHRIGRWGRGP